MAPACASPVPSLMAAKAANHHPSCYVQPLIVLDVAGKIGENSGRSLGAWPLLAGKLFRLCHKAEVACAYEARDETLGTAQTLQDLTDRQVGGAVGRGCRAYREVGQQSLQSRFALPRAACQNVRRCSPGGWSSHHAACIVQQDGLNLQHESDRIILYEFMN